MLDNIGPKEHQAVNDCLKYILSARHISKDDKHRALNLIDEFIRCYPLLDNRQSKYYCAMAFDKLDAMGLIDAEYWE